MSAPKKRKSDIHSDDRDHADHQTKKEKHWFEEKSEQNGENRRSSIFKGFLKKVKSSTTLKSTNKSASSSKMDTIANETHLSITSESSITSVESCHSAQFPNVAKNAMLRTLVNRDSFTPVPPPDGESVTFILPEIGSSKLEFTSKMDDAISIESRMSIGSCHTIDEDSASIGSTSVFCTPSRNPLMRNGLRMSTRSVPENQDDMPPALFRSLCNSAVRRVPTSKSEGGGTPMRRSMRMSIQKRNLSSKNMEDVPEEEALTVSNSSIRVDAPIAEEDEEVFGAAKEYFDNNVTSHNDSADEGTCSMSRLSTTSERASGVGGSSIFQGRRSSIFRKIFPGKSESKDRRMSDNNQASEQYMDKKSRRASVVSFNEFTSVSGLSVNDSASKNPKDLTESPQQPKLRKKTASSSNLSQRISSVFRMGSNSTVKLNEYVPSPIVSQSSRRNTLTGNSSISSGVGSIASGTSDQGYGTIGSRSGQSISRCGSRRDDEGKKERTRRLLDRIIISDVPAGELLKLKIEQVKKQKQLEMDELFETQLTESSSSDTSQSENLQFDVVAVDIKADGSPFSTTAATFMDSELSKRVKEEIVSNYRPDRCGSITEYEPELVFVMPEQPQASLKSLNDSVSSNADINLDHLRNVRSGLCKSIEEWKRITKMRESSTMLIYPMFCQSEEEWDSKGTIDAIFLMLDGILMNTKRWMPNGKCILAGVTPNNVILLRNKFDELKLSVAISESDGPASSNDDFDTQSTASTSTVFGAKI